MGGQRTVSVQCHQRFQFPVCFISASDGPHLGLKSRNTAFPGVSRAGEPSAPWVVLAGERGGGEGRRGVRGSSSGYGWIPLESVEHPLHVLHQLLSTGCVPDTVLWRAHMMSKAGCLGASSWVAGRQVTGAAGAPTTPWPGSQGWSWRRWPALGSPLLPASGSPLGPPLPASIPSVPSAVSRAVLQGPPERERCLALFQVDLTFQ